LYQQRPSLKNRQTVKQRVYFLSLRTIFSTPIEGPQGLIAVVPCSQFYTLPWSEMIALCSRFSPGLGRLANIAINWPKICRRMVLVKPSFSPLVISDDR
jgi:hypothetical protein